MRTSRNLHWAAGAVLTAMLVLVAAGIAYASSVDESIVDTTAPTGNVTLAAGGTAAITINLSVTGNQVGTATFDVNRDFTLSGGVFTGSNPQGFTVNPRAASDPPTTFSTTGTVTVAGTQADGAFTLAVGAFNIVNSNTTGAKLNAGISSNYAVTVSTPALSDTTPPVIDYTLTPADPDGGNGWYKSDVTLTWTVTENESPGSLVRTGCVDQNITADQPATTYSCSATSDGGSVGPVDVTIERDATEPSVAYTSGSPAANLNGWNNSDVTATFTATDTLSGFAGPSTTATGTATTNGEGSALTVGSPAFTDLAGNTAPAGAATSAVFKVDKTAPSNIAFTGGGLSDGASYYFGSVPAGPTGCTADDATSGVASCTLDSGYGTTVGSHTIKATATDYAGNQAQATLSYTVLAWTLKGFYQPVDMNGTWNTVKGGSTVPFKFEIFAGTTELTDTADVAGFTATPTTCPNGNVTTDAIEVTTTGGSSLRYDTTAGQFVYNWQTPKKPGACYKITMTTLDNSSLTANFLLK